MRRALAALVALLLLSSAAPAWAWGFPAHETIASLASLQLTPEASAEVERLLGDRASNAMREASRWADDQRELPGAEALKRMHFVNFPRDSCGYVAARDCPGGRCVVESIVRFERVLRESRDEHERADALRWLIHLVGDVHQPLHAGYLDDRGGNSVQLRYRGQGTNLHALLDVELLRSVGLRPVEHAGRLFFTRRPPTAEAAAWSPDAPGRWATESCALAREAYPPGRIDPAYEERMLRVLEQRLLLSGARLAALLNAVLTPRDPAECDCVR